MGHKSPKLLLSERTYVCGACGLVIDRDENAAVNLAEYGRKILSGSGSESNGRGADRKTPVAGQVAVKRQPGGAARAARETGTLPPQGESAA